MLQIDFEGVFSKPCFLPFIVLNSWALVLFVLSENLDKYMYKVCCKIPDIGPNKTVISRIYHLQFTQIVRGNVRLLLLS